jgi:DtxR family Mn-dependent transcriptional regulator
LFVVANICPKRIPSPTESSSLEDYLEAIFLLSGSVGGAVRVTDLSDKLGVSKPSASAAVKRLTEEGLVSHEPYGDIKLTTTGRRRARDVASRHELLLRFLHDILGLEETIAEADACRLEHGLGPETVKRLSQFVEFLTGGKHGEKPWNRGFNEYLSAGKHHADLVSKG